MKPANHRQTQPKTVFKMIDTNSVWFKGYQIRDEDVRCEDPETWEKEQFELWQDAIPALGIISAILLFRKDMMKNGYTHEQCKAIWKKYRNR